MTHENDESKNRPACLHGWHAKACPWCNPDAAVPRPVQDEDCDLNEPPICAADPADTPKGIHFWVNGIVAARNGQPYIQLSNEKGMIAQLSMGEARKVAMDILQMASRTEADAMIVKFFGHMDFPDGAVAALMQEFRDFRMALDTEAVEGSFGNPEEEEQ